MQTKQHIKRAILYIFVLVFLVAFSSSAKAQDIHFTQFFANKLYLAPSFAGSTLQNRVYTNYRIQWPGLPKSYTTYCTSFDHYFNNFNSGLGVLALRDVAGAGRYGTFMGAIQYSYDFQFNDFWHLRPGVQFTYLQRSLDFSKLTFSSYQTTDQSNYEPNGTVTFPEDNSVGAFDVASSVIVYNSKIWVGLSIDHLMQPNLSILADENNVVPMKTSVFGGVTLIRKGRLLRPIDETLSVAFMFKNQAKYSQLDMGIYWNKSPLVFGLWYRGLPIFNSDRGDMFAFLVGYKTQRISIGYSYDFTVSNLLDKTAGAHELSMSIEFAKYTKKRKLHSVPCPEF